MRADEYCRRVLADGFAAIRHETETPGSFPAAVEAEAAAARPAPTHRSDLTDLAFVTLDPATSTDLDQALFCRRDADDLVLLYAIADVGAFVPRGSGVEAEAWARGVTIYAPDRSVPLYPPVLSNGKASLLPDGPRPAIVLHVAVDGDGGARLRHLERAWVRSRAKLAYESVTPSDLPSEFAELVARLNGAEERRGAFRVDLPSQEVVHDEVAPGGLRLRFAPRLPSEDDNASLSLAANLAVAAAMREAGLGLFRTMDEPDDRELASLRRAANGLSISWSGRDSLRSVVPRLDPDDPRHVAFLIAARRAAGGAGYTVWEAASGGPDPWHAAVAATYAHATAPMRRLADRYVLELLLAQSQGGPLAGDLDRDLLSRLAAVMKTADRRAARVDRESVDLVECVSLIGREGEVFRAVVVDRDRDAATVQLLDAAVRTRVRLDAARPGDTLRVRLESVDLTQRRLVLSPFSPP